jgi:hypothetical protein
VDGSYRGYEALWFFDVLGESLKLAEVDFWITEHFVSLVVLSIKHSWNVQQEKFSFCGMFQSFALVEDSAISRGRTRRFMAVPVFSADTSPGPVAVCSEVAGRRSEAVMLVVLVSVAIMIVIVRVGNEAHDSVDGVGSEMAGGRSGQNERHVGKWDLRSTGDADL